MDDPSWLSRQARDPSAVVQGLLKMDGMILYTCADLLWGTRLKSTAEGLGLAARPVRSAQMLADRVAEGGVTGLIVDLETGELGLELIGVAARAGIRVVAFGPHVATEALAAARDAGADRVMARGAFAERLPQILAALASNGPGSPESRG